MKLLLDHGKKLFHPVRSFNRRCRSSISDCSKVRVEFSNGNTLKLSKGQYAKLADGCAVGEIGNTTVMVTAVSKDRTNPASFVPLQVDYRQKAAAAGRIPTNFVRRELGPSDHEILTSRLIDRSLRPLFPAGFSNDTHITCNLLAVDGVHDPDIISINAASAALMLSDIPWNGPVGAVRVGMLDDNLIVNPTRKELSNSSLNLIVVAADQSLVVMLEGSANNILQQDFKKAVSYGVKECQGIIQSLYHLRKLGKTKRPWTPPEPWKEDVVVFIESLSKQKLTDIFVNYTEFDKLSRDNAIKTLRSEILEKVKTDMPTTSEVEAYCMNVFDYVCKKVFRSLILDKNIRCDGRAMDQLRHISCEVDLYPPLHGSALFQRGQTQVLCTVALDSIESALKLDQISVLTSGLKEKNFFLHYDFPSYATNDLSIRRSGSTARREIGHGALAERALRSVVPSNFPFTIRLTSEVLESNGSSSMASVCGGSLALMDAGVPIETAAAGVAIGLVTDYDDNDTKHMKKYNILTDILGIEDYFGDMDFKLAGTKKGITAIQADIKIPGVPLKVIMEAVQAGSVAKSNIIDIMNGVISTHRTKRKENWPVSEKLEVEAYKRSKLIGHGGINLKKLLIETGVQVTSHEDGLFTLFAPNQDAMEEAKEHIEKILNEPTEKQLDFGAIYKAKIVEVRETGVMVTLYDGMVPTLLHNTQLDQRKISHPSALGLKVGDEINVKYFGRDPVSGVVRLSRKVLLSPPSGVTQCLRRSADVE